MKEASHTPGPRAVVSELRDTDEIICDMMNAGYVAITAGQKLANWRDDARLIAAAPDLLALVQRMRSYMDQAGIDSKPESMNPMEKLASDIDVMLANL
jgi:hypothetical protein